MILLKYCLGLFLLLFSASGFSQEITVKIRVLNAKKEPVASATLKVHEQNDLTKKSELITNDKGLAELSLVKDKTYKLIFSSVDYNSFSKNFIPSDKQSEFIFTADQKTQTLTDVVVVARKPLMRQEDDKTIVDPEPLAETSTNAYEILEKTPGIFVDQEGNVYLNSTTPAQVYINGRETRMSASDLGSLLKSLPPNAIAKMEILRTPSAKFDASGGGGIVNLVLKKGVKLGLTGSINAGFNQGRFGNQFIGFNLNNNNNEGRTSYINVQASNRSSYEATESQRLFAPDSALAQEALTVYPAKNIYTGYGFGWQKKVWDFQYDGRISYNKNDNYSDNINKIEVISSGNTLRNFLNTVNNNGTNIFINQGGSAKYKIDTVGSEWTSDISYNFSNNTLEQGFETFNTANQNSLNEGIGDIHNSRHFLTAQTDLKLRLKNKLTVETGLKTSLTNFNSDAEYFAVKANELIKDNFRTNRYTYKEGIHAGYFQASKTFGDFIIKAGTRIENTNMNGVQKIPFDTSFSLNRTDLFPYVYLSKEIMKIAGYPIRSYLVYRRTISRPAYEQLNPFPRYVDQFLYETGNPSLRPQFTKNYEANISVEDWPIIALGYNDTKDIFTQVVYQSDTAQQLAYRTYDNLGTNKELYFRATAVIPPGKRYFFVLGSQYNRNFYEGLYENKPLSFKRGTWSFFTYHSFKIDKRSTISFNGFMRLKGQQQFYELGNFGSLNANLNRQFLNRKLTITINVQDIFRTNKYPFTLNQGSITATGIRYSDTRRFGLNLRYNFGIKKKEENNNPMQFQVPEGS